VSSTRVATPELVRQLVREVREQLGDRLGDEPLAIGVRARPVWAHGELTDDGAAPIAVVPCPTPLAARRALADFGGDASAALVMLTDLAEIELGNDILARLVRPRLLGLSSWDALRQRFGVRDLDPAFSDPRYSWMADALLEIPAPAVRPGVGMLAVEYGLRLVAEHVLGTVDTTVEGLLEASAHPGFVARVEQADPRTVEQLCAALGEHHGPAARLVGGAIARGHGERAVPAGLVARTLIGGFEGAFAQAKVAELTGVTDVGDDALEAWARAAEQALDRLVAEESPVVDEIVAVGSALADEWRAPRPEESNVLGIGFEARLEALAVVLDQTLAAPATADAATMRARVRAIAEHRAARTDLGRPRAQRAELAARLVAWLVDPGSGAHGAGVTGGATPLSIQASIAAYVADGAWVDAARRRVGQGDDTPPQFAAVLRRIGEAAYERRADGNRAFADALARFTVDGTAGELTGPPAVAIESVLGEVAGLAALQPTLLVVLDGCGLAPFLEFADQFRQFGFREIGPNGERRVALSALPTVTGVSRTSLLTGSLRTGTADEESRGLPAHRAVAKLPGPDAVVFHHHRDLVGGIGINLPGPVIDALGPSGPRLVAVVVNTIDDELSHGTYNPEYRIENLGPLPSLLAAAARAGRAVVITADHGHVLGVGLDGQGAVDRAGQGGERWRIADREPSADEVLLRGPRVLFGDERGILAPWSDDLRYSARRGGYHGGATPDECIVPFAAFLPFGLAEPRGWELVEVVTPAWWDLDVRVRPEPGRRPTGKTKRPPTDAGQGEFFPKPVDGEQEGAGQVAPPEPVRVVWLDALLASELYGSQLAQVGRARLPEARVRPALSVLVGRGGVAAFAVIARATGMPVARVGGFLALLARLLNVDGYGVLVIDNQAREVRLDEALLRAQFLGGGSQ